MSGDRRNRVPAGPCREAHGCERTVEALGPRPREALSALVDYGLSDEDIARYHGVARDAVVALRGHWGIGGGIGGGGIGGAE